MLELQSASPAAAFAFEKLNWTQLLLFLLAIMSARHHRPGPYHVGPGGEGVRERRLFAPALPEPIDPLPHHHSNLASVNAGSAIPLGRQWDIDYVCLELTPAALCRFSQYWVLGGRSVPWPLVKATKAP